MKISSWGNYQSNISDSLAIAWRQEVTQLPKGSLLACGLRRSYGDSCINSNGTMLFTQHLNHLIYFDDQQGILHCESGVSLADIIKVFIPQGWFLPVVPGTKYVTIGGAIANDIHGKNHHQAGSFANHVVEFTLLRSDGTRLLCSKKTNTDYYYATMGGLGLTGLIIDAKIKLIRIPSEYLTVDYVPFYHLDEFITLSENAIDGFEYTVAWFDCLSHKQCKGIFMQANFVESESITNMPKVQAKQLSVPFNFPGFALNNLSIKQFNQRYFAKQAAKGSNCIEHYDKFFFPLDSIQNWNKIYGARGFWQYQCQIPWENAKTATQEILDTIALAKQGSFLAVLKTFGDAHPHTLLSFPNPGITIALDFANHGHKTTALLNRLDQILLAAKGRIYPAKDMRMSSKLFQQGYPKLNEFIKLKDPNFTSDLWNRLIG